VPLATDVRLPRDHVPVFPAVCCGCLAAGPRELLRIGARRLSWWEWVFPWLWLTQRRAHAEVPACGPCLQRWRRRWWVVRAAAALLLAVGLACALWLRPGDGLSRGWRRLVGGCFVALFALPVFLWALFRPPIAALTVEPDHVDYEYASAAHAERFRQLNRLEPLRSRPGGPTGRPHRP
jgi:hypothetical protein